MQVLSSSDYSNGDNSNTEGNNTNTRDSSNNSAGSSSEEERRQFTSTEEEDLTYSNARCARAWRKSVQRSANVLVRGLVKFVPAS